VKNYLNLLLAQDHPLRFALSRVLMASGLSSFLILDRGRFRMKFFPTPTLALVWMNSAYKRPEEDFFVRYLRPGDAVVDAGANVGYLSLLSASIVGDQGRVISIEAHPRIFSYLDRNITLNRFRNVRCVHAALSDIAGSIQFSDKRWDELNSVVPDENGKSGLAIPALPLDLILTDSAAIHLLKVDVEGFEERVFLGSPRALTRTQCIYFEYEPENYARLGSDLSRLIDVLSNAGFRVYRFTAPARLTRLRQPISTRSKEDLVAVRDLAQFVERTSYAVDE